MFGREKVAKRGQNSDSPFGVDLLNNCDLNDMGADDDDDDDEDLEAELLRLTTDGDMPQRPPRRPAPKPPVNATSLNLDVLNEKEIGSDDELSGADDDPDLLNELASITGTEGSPEIEKREEPNPSAEDNASNVTGDIIKLLEERLSLYTAAEAKAKSSNESSKARRYGRGVKTLQGMLRDAKAGRNVAEAEIPPLLPKSATRTDDTPILENLDAPQDIPSVPVVPGPEPQSEPEPQSSTVPENVPIDEEKLAQIKERQHEYKIAAVAWKKSGNLTNALNYAKIAKQFDLAIAAASSGQPIELDGMPPSPELPGVTAAEEAPEQTQKEESETQEEPSASAHVTSDIEGALKERLEVYRRTKTTAEGEGNASKARRYGRICKQYEDAIKMHARGKPIPVNELPTPPGFPPIVVDTPSPSPAPTSKPAVDATESSESATGNNRPVVPQRVPKNPSGAMTRAQKQTLILQKRQKEFKQAALAAKKEGDLEVALNYLKQAKGFDKLIEMSNCGFPVDMTSIPISPDSKAELNEGENIDSFTLLSTDEIPMSEGTGTDEEIYKNLEATLEQQKKVCLATRNHFKAIGDIPSYNKWERMALGYSRDLDMLRVRKRDGLPPPQHHYEHKTYAIVKSCIDLSDSEVEISIIRGINYPKELDTYVIYEFPLPTDSPSTERTSTLRGEMNPEYDATYKLAVIDRSSRQCQRAFKRHSLKCQVWSKGGFFRSDSLLGTVTVKLLPLETQCTIHDAFPIMNGRKATGGKLELKINLRNPIVSKQIDKLSDNWLIIDY